MKAEVHAKDAKQDHWISAALTTLTSTGTLGLQQLIYLLGCDAFKRMKEGGNRITSQSKEPFVVVHYLIKLSSYAHRTHARLRSIMQELRRLSTTVDQAKAKTSAGSIGCHKL
jgi:hypothetical protein